MKGEFSVLHAAEMLLMSLHPCSSGHGYGEAGPWLEILLIVSENPIYYNIY